MSNCTSMVMNGGEIKNNTANSSSGYLGHYGGGIYLSIIRIG